MSKALRGKSYRSGVGALSVWIASGLMAGAPRMSPFVNEAAVRGISYSTGGFQASGCGVALADLDEDGDPDVVLTGQTNGVTGVYENDGSGHFINRSSTSGIASMGSQSGVIAGDYDGDSDLDLYFSNWNAPNVLARNDGNFHFTNVAVAAGVADPGFGTGCAFGDYDGDGWLDLYVSNLTSPPFLMSPSRLFQNLGNGTFQSVNMAIPPLDNGFTWSTTFVDYDADADCDIYVSNDKGVGLNCAKHNYLFRNDRGVFVDVTDESGTAACIDSMGVGIGDLNNDTKIDMYCTNTPSGNPLFLNNGDGTFAEQSALAGTQAFETGWGAMFFDFDHDGIEDLYVCNETGPSQLFKHAGAFPCVDVAPEMGVAIPNNTFCVASGDVDGDGDLDMLVQRANSLVALFINHEGQKRKWAKFNVSPAGNNTFAVGASVYARTGSQWQVRQVLAGSNYKSQNDLTVHFGVSDATIIDEVKVVWPGGVLRTLTNVPTEQEWTLYHPAQLGDADQNGVCDLNDYFIFYQCLGPGSLQVGCEMMDLVGDGDIDVDDFQVFLAQYEDPLQDCNRNGIADLMEIVTGLATDKNLNAIPDPCEVPDLPGDITGNGVVDVDDLLAVINAWGNCFKPPAPCPADVAPPGGNGAVEVDDLLLVINHWS